MKRWCLAVLIASAAHAAEDPAVVTAKDQYQAGRYHDAEVAFKTLVAASPTDVEALYYLGKVTVHLGDYPAAIRLLEHATALAPNRSDCFLWLGNAYAWAAAAAPMSDKPALGRSCLAAYRKALELDPANLRAHFSLMNFYRHVPALFGGGLDKAHAEADAIRRQDAIQGAYATAVLCIDEKKYGQAYANLTAILRRNSSDYAANCTLGSLAISSGEYLEEGEASFRRCLDLCPGENDKSHEFVGLALQQIARARAEAGGRIAVLDRGAAPLTSGH